LKGAARIAVILLGEAAPVGLPADFDPFFSVGYDFPMTKLLERAVEAARGLPPEAQDEIARLVLQLAGDDEPQIPLSDDERASIAVSKAAAARGEFATDEQVRAVWAKHGL
jgi:hypothetical protein